MALRQGRAGARHFWLLALALTAIGLLAAASSPVKAAVAQAESCSYNAGTRMVTASIETDAEATLVVVGGELWFGAVPVPCGGATTTNTDSISINGTAGTTETLVLDQRGGFFGPGVTAESNVPEIEIATALGDAADRAVVYGTDGSDHLAAGQNGFATSSDGDVDVTFSPAAFQLEVHTLDGDDYFNGRGEGGAGLHFLGPIVATGGSGNESLLRGSSEPDSIDGGPGNDELRGQEANDVLVGGDGNDVLAGGGENDTLTGGRGLDSYVASDGDDTIFAEDDEADPSINGGPGFDTAHVDALDPVPLATEIVIRPSESCSYDGGTLALSLTMTPASTATLVVVDGAIWFGEVPVPCGGATTTNTDSISIEGAVGTTETLILDQRGGFFGPGATPEFNTPEIEIATNLGDAADRVVVWGTEGPDFMAAGQNGVATSSDGDVDITFAPSSFRLDVHLVGGDDHFDGRGTGGAGLHFLGPIVLTGGDGNEGLLRGGSAPDTIGGGSGNDLLDAQEGDDVLTGGPGNDTMTAGGGNDTIDGGPGTDTFNGNDGNDTFLAQDDEADALLSGGPGADTAYIDTGLDPQPVTVENVVGDGTPPPPPATGCTYDVATRVAAAAIAPGEAATLVAVGGEIRFGTVPVACGAATTANTDTITVTGAAGSAEALTIDLSSSPFAPGATAEATGTSEIEISVALGDTTDLVLVYGTAGADTISAGTSGLSFTTDADADITLAQVPALLEIFGLAGPNTVTGAGGAGSGGPYPGRLALHAGDSGDTLRGGSGNDELYGGTGNDVLEGRNGNEFADGGPGNDSVAGNDGDDQLIGGSGADALIGGNGADVLRADDDEADTNLNGGPGSDTAHFDQGIDVAPVAVETLIPS
jgi:Ca2+-binding RTX toxin-like protein